MIRIGIVGCGTMADRHIAAFNKISGAQVNGICDNNFKLLDVASNRYHISPFHNYQDLIKDPDIDAIDVCVPTIYHHEVVLAALSNGKHVFCEKPLTHKLEYALEIKERLNSSDRVLMTGYLYNFHPSFIRLREILEAKVLDDPYFAIFRIGGRGNKRIWKHMADTGGGAMLEMLVHMLDLAAGYFGDFEVIDPLFCGTILTNRTVEGKKIVADADDCVYLRLRTKKGVEIFCEADLLSPSYMNYVEVHGENGSFFGSILDYFPTIVHCNEPRGIYDQGRNIFPNTRVDLVMEELTHFIKVLNGEAKKLLSIDTEIEVVKVIEEIRKSAKRGLK